MADWLDFPLNPPDGERANGGGDFGVFRSRYDKFHAGEDWGLGSRSNLGSPVYSIGTGIVTYAQPLGWGVDQGVIIIRHVLPGGRAIFSFYGHLDPPSIELRAGDCVVRGEQIGQIGRPRGWPHLHFEIRTHLPEVPGPGYWPTDPVRAGWLPPSAFIWDERIKAMPNILWTRLDYGRPQEEVGMLGNDTFIVLKDQTLIAIDLENGSERWRWQPVSSDDEEPLAIETALIAAGAEGIYTADQLGGVRRLEFAGSGNGTPGEANFQAPREAWQIDLDTMGVPVLMPLFDGGLVVSTASGMFGLSPQGEILWQRKEIPPVTSWSISPEGVLVATTGEDQLWQIEPSGPELLANMGGVVAFSQRGIYLYTGSQIFHLEADGDQAESVLELPAAYPGLGAITALPDGGLILGHPDRADSRLMLIDSDGNLSWEWSLAELEPLQVWFLQSEGDLYLLMERRSSAGSKVDLFAVDLETGALLEVFRGGSRTPRRTLTSGLGLSEGRLLLQIGGGSLLMLRPGVEN